ncbi:MAG TPA: response regulator transcription factor [Humisphaera sp.]
MRVLIVEDDPEINHLLCAYAQIAGFAPDPALDAASALAAAAARTPDLVVLDVMLPDMDGLEVCRRLRAEPATATVPVIVLTALTAQATRDAAAACGVAEFMAKPFDPDELILAMRAHVNWG